MVVDMVPFMAGLFGPSDTISPDRARSMAEATLEGILGQNQDALRRSMSASISKMIRTDSLRSNILERGMASDQTVYARAMRDLFQLDLRPEMAAVKVPVTVLYVHGPIIPLTGEQTDTVYRAQFANVAQAKLVRIPDAYHFVMLDQPERFAREVSAFLKAA